ncbi:MAG: MarR family transcriptional regulator [Clostridiales bacterium]|jgi:DNA-binding MarR family transcriptional regulator|nr:MarR family transcriptional regulator [Clostridiales bacterium]
MEYNPLKLENQLCFPLYAAAKEVVKKYTPLLRKIGLTYTQYITMMALWEDRAANVKALGEKLFLDSGTLTPLLKRLETAGLVERRRGEADERNVMVTITDKGLSLREKALEIPMELGRCLDMTAADSKTLYVLLYKILRQ